MTSSNKILETFLTEEFGRRKSKDPKYSLRSFARDAQLEASTLGQLLKGKRRISIEKTKTILEHLHVPPTTCDEVLCDMLGIHREKFEKKLKHTVWPSLGDELMATWLCYAILSLFELKDFQSSANWIAKKLGAPINNVKNILDLLEEASLISRKIKPWSYTQVSLTTQPGYQVKSVNQVHTEYLELSIAYLKNMLECGHDRLVSTSDYSGLTFAFNSKNLPTVVAKIKDFRRSLAALLDEETKHDAVYRIGIQVFPLTKNDE